MDSGMSDRINFVEFRIVGGKIARVVDFISYTGGFMSLEKELHRTIRRHQSQLTELAATEDALANCPVGLVITRKALVFKAERQRVAARETETMVNELKSHLKVGDQVKLPLKGGK